MRAKMRGIMKQICRVYPASKWFSYVIKGLESKNARTRIECLEELSTLIQRNGLAVCNNPAKTFPVIAAQISDRDSGVRNAAINVITQSYLLVGVQVYKLIGKISDKDKSLLDEKFKRLKSGSSNSVSSVEVTEPVRVNVKESAPSSLKVEDTEMTETLGSTPKEFSLDFDFDFPTKSGAVARSDSETASTTAINTALNALSLSSITLDSSGDPAMMEFIINQVTSSDSEVSINALKHLEKTLVDVPSSFNSCLNDIVSAITIQIRLSFTAADITDPNVSRLCKHLVNMLVQIFSNTTLPGSLKREPLCQCVKELLNRLLDPVLNDIESGTQITKALNVLMVRILDSCNRNDTFRYFQLILVSCWKFLKILVTL